MSDIFKIGSLFPDKASLEACVERFQKQNCVNLWKQHSRSIASVAKKNPGKAAAIKPELCVTELNYCCVRGGREYKAKVFTGQRPDQKTRKMGCPFVLKFRATKDGQHLMLVDMKNEHNHQVNQEEFQLYPSQCRLDSENREEVKDLCKMQANRKLIRQTLAEKTGKRIVMKDIHNIAVKSRIHGSSTKETADDLARWIADSYPSLSTEFVVSNNEMTGLFLQDAQMQSSFEKFPEVLLVDATHKTSDTEMPLYALLVVDGNGESEVAAIFLVKHEDEASIRQMVQIFKGRKSALTWDRGIT